MEWNEEYVILNVDISSINEIMVGNMLIVVFKITKYIFEKHLISIRSVFFKHISFITVQFIYVLIKIRFSIDLCGKKVKILAKMFSKFSKK